MPKMSDLPDATPMAGDELIPVVQNGITKKALSADFVGPTGPTGPQGATGATGPTGPTPTLPPSGLNLNVPIAGWYASNIVNGVTGAYAVRTLPASYLHFMPFMPVFDANYDRVAAKVGSNLAGSTMYVGIYSSDPATFLPKTPIVTSGELSSAVASGLLIPHDTAFTLNKNTLYWLVVGSGATPPSLSVVGEGCGINMSVQDPTISNQRSSSLFVAWTPGVFPTDPGGLLPNSFAPPAMFLRFV